MTRSWLRYPLMLCAGLMLLLALWGGMSRLDVPIPMILIEAASHHGLLMVSGFLGTLIGVERASALKMNWPWSVPICSAVGGFLIFAPVDTVYAGGFFVVAGLMMSIVFGYILTQQFTVHGSFLMLAAVCWAGGNLLWTLGWPMYEVVYWWMGFLVLTITAERLELNRVIMISQFRKYSLISASLLFLIALVVMLRFPIFGKYVVGISLILLGIWLLKFDLARGNIKETGERRYRGFCLFIGYLWLPVGGLLLMLFPEVQAGYHFDSILHSVFLGFVFSMIFGHALVIFPSVVKLPIFYHPYLYIALVLLHLGVIVRLFGNFMQNPAIRHSGGGTNFVAIVLFLMLLLPTSFLEKSIQNQPSPK